VALSSPRKEPQLYNILVNKMIELKLLMLGIPKDEINQMTSAELQLTLHLLSYMNRQSKEELAENVSVNKRR